MRLSSVADLLSERFVRPLVIDRVRALVEPAAAEARDGEPSVAFALLEQEAGELADEPSGAGFDLPDWLETLEAEVDRVCDRSPGWDAEDDLPVGFPVGAADVGRNSNAIDGLGYAAGDFDRPAETAELNCEVCAGR